MKKQFKPAGPSAGVDGKGSRPGLVLELGVVLAAGMAVFTFLGYYLDKKRGTEPFWMICGGIAGFLFGVYQVWRIVALQSERQNPGNGHIGKTGEAAAKEGDKNRGSSSLPEQ